MKQRIGNRCHGTPEFKALVRFGGQLLRIGAARPIGHHQSPRQPRPGAYNTGATWKEERGI